MKSRSPDADEARDSAANGRSRQQSESTTPERSRPLESLHRSVGNQAVQALHERGDLQAKLAVSSPTDPAEREAERVASEVMQTTESNGPVDIGDCPDVHRSASAGVAGESLTGDAEDQVRSSLGSGKPLPESTRSSFEARFGRDFSDVRIHASAAVDEAARSIDAEAFTLGSDVAFAGGNYDPNSRSGQELLAHELAHVVQQGGGAVRKQSGDTTGQTAPDDRTSPAHRSDGEQQVYRQESSTDESSDEERNGPVREGGGSSVRTELTEKLSGHLTDSEYGSWIIAQSLWDIGNSMGGWGKSVYMAVLIHGYEQYVDNVLGTSPLRRVPKDVEVSSPMGLVGPVTWMTPEQLLTRFSWAVSAAQFFSTATLPSVDEGLERLRDRLRNAEQFWVLATIGELGLPDTHEELLRDAFAASNPSLWPPQLAQRLEDRAADLKDALGIVADKVDVSSEEKATLVQALLFPYPRPDLPESILRQIRPYDEDDNPHGLRSRSDRQTLIGILGHPKGTREETDVPPLNKEKAGDSSGGYLEASEEKLAEFRTFFESHIPDNLDLDPDDLLQQSTDLISSHPNVGTDTPPLELPPRSLWGDMVPTLELIGELGDLGGTSFTVKSSYRSELVNALAGGADGSAHMSFAGLDLQPSNPARFEALVKFFWHERGPDLDMGLGFYRPGRIHIDTLGFRDWGDGEPGSRYQEHQRFQRMFGVDSLEDL